MTVIARPFHEFSLEAAQSPLGELPYWSIITAYGLAAAEGIKLSSAHLDVLDWLRTDYENNSEHFRQYLIHRLDAAFSGQGGILHVYRLFPEGLLQALKIAGLPVQPGATARTGSMH